MPSPMPSTVWLNANKIKLAGREYPNSLYRERGKERVNVPR